ncbi:MAG: putative sugar nucleotidyl transferase [bacterium]
MKVLVYEDHKYKDLFPLNMLRASYDIRCGANTLLERIKCIVKNKHEVVLHCRNVLVPFLRETHPANKVNSIDKDDYLLLNGRVIFSEELLNMILKKKEKNKCYVYKNIIAAAFISKENSIMLKEFIGNSDNVFNGKFFDGLYMTKKEIDVGFALNVINYPWDILKYLLTGGLQDDMEYYLRDKKFKKAVSSDNIINNKKIYIAKNVKLYPGIVLDASNGEIIIEENAVIEPFAFIKGPVIIGKNCTVKSGTKIYGPCVIGEYSKVSGEIAESVFHAYVNKQHDGFIGHSYICPFVNLGADTVTSDLKNNYSEINLGGIDTGMRFLGSLIGDHSKTAINTMMNTGSRVGIFSNIFGSGFPEKEIPSFAWNEIGKNTQRYDIKKALDTARIVMERRGVIMSKNYESLVEAYYN